MSLFFSRSTAQRHVRGIDSGYVRSHHTKIMTALHYPEFECIKLHLAKKSEGLQSVPAEPSGKTNRRGGKSRRKAQGSGEAVQPAVVVI